ncbi:hypothetical protein FSP39_014823 [Pinctada imbricata]|uniref:Conodipine-M alpha chain n=1 Tax=Pinctada imbricata TaxID=66713 RepID=A0AA88XJ59_PINIB|nr:hypothetical protein FSP39_014823 [Pinctada imbricata]
MFGVVLTSAILVAAARADFCLEHAPAGAVDGCSIPLDLPFFFKDYFTSACNKHDVCYDCASHFGHDRSYCDHTFHNNLNAMCNHMSKRFLFSAASVNKVECKAAALTYYEAVHLGAASHFRNQSVSYCRESWVRSCV